MRETHIGALCLVLAISGCSYFDVQANQRFWSKIERNYESQPGMRRVIHVTAIDPASPASWFITKHIKMVYATPSPYGEDQFVEYVHNDENRYGYVDSLRVHCEEGRIERARSFDSFDEEDADEEVVWQPPVAANLKGWERDEYCNGDWSAERRAIREANSIVDTQDRDAS